MKTFSFLELANALRWMQDNTSGKAFLLNFKWFDIVIIKRKETAGDLSKKVKTQIEEFNRKDFELKRRSDICAEW